MSKYYIGDGVYAEVDQFRSVTITTSNGLRVTNTIVLEPEVWEALARFRETIIAQMRREAKP